MLKDKYLKPKNRKEGYPMISCHECGHACIPAGFENMIGLCDHLYLDA